MSVTLERIDTAPFGAATHLVCRACGAHAKLGADYSCWECFGPLEVAYDFGTVTREQIQSGPFSLWRYAPLLPVPANIAESRNLAPGMTRLHRADNLAKALGITGTLWVKDDSGNPTHSFKDRVVAVAQSAGIQLGFNTLACASTGNLAHAVAAAAARAGQKSVVLVPSNLEQHKIQATAAYNGHVIGIEGNYDDVNRLCGELIGEEVSADWGFVNVNLRPYYAEGSKTVGYEIAEQLGWRLPDQVVIPVASGALLTKVDKGWREFVELGLVESKPWRVFGAQATGCNPVSTAWADGSEVVRPVKPDTIAKSLAIGNPADGPYALDAVRRTNGAVGDVTDAEVVEGIRLLAECEGIFGETSGGVTVAVTRKLLAEGLLDPTAETVIVNTGEGLKTLDAVATGNGFSATISPNVESVAKVIEGA
ncbi:MAG: threonine synthase [Actinobacteria bacterium]|jgi:threonine synthase|nr:threonine synthase [Actinomycetota bacterium]